MKTLRLLFVVMMVVAFAAATGALAAEWYVVKHKSGKTAITDQKPGPGWTTIGGPYKTKDAAARAAEIDPKEGKLEPIGKVGAEEGASQQWYVVKHKLGETALYTSDQPGPGWTVVSGPYKTKDAAARSAGVDPSKIRLAPIGQTAAEEKAESGTYYAVKHKSGNMAVVDHKPDVPGWTVVGGPYSSQTEAARKHNIDPGNVSLEPGSPTTAR